MRSHGGARGGQGKRRVEPYLLLPESECLPRSRDDTDRSPTDHRPMTILHLENLSTVPIVTTCMTRWNHWAGYTSMSTKMGGFESLTPGEESDGEPLTLTPPTDSATPKREPTVATQLSQSGIETTVRTFSETHRRCPPELAGLDATAGDVHRRWPEKYRRRIR